MYNYLFYCSQCDCQIIKNVMWLNRTSYMLHKIQKRYITDQEAPSDQEIPQYII